MVKSISLTKTKLKKKKIQWKHNQATLTNTQKLHQSVRVRRFTAKKTIDRMNGCGGSKNAFGLLPNPWFPRSTHTRDLKSFAIESNSNKLGFRNFNQETFYTWFNKGYFPANASIFGSNRCQTYAKEGKVIKKKKCR